MAKKRKINKYVGGGGAPKMHNGILIYNRVKALESVGLSTDEATKQAKDEICATLVSRSDRANLRRWYNQNVNQVAHHVNQKAIVEKAKAKIKPTKPFTPAKNSVKPLINLIDPWQVAKSNQEHELEMKRRESKRLSKTLKTYAPAVTDEDKKYSCLICGAEFGSKAGLRNHKRNQKHHIADQIGDLTYHRGEEPKKVVALPIVKKKVASVENNESFNDRWIRLFSEKGYNSPMVEAFKRDATKQHMTVKQIHDFLAACKPIKQAPIETPFKAPVGAVEAVVELLEPITIVEPVEALVEAPTRSERVVLRPTINDEKAKAEFSDRVVKMRTNQADFAKRVAANFGGACAITGSREGCQAAHIEPVSTGNNNTSNGVFMLSSLHWMFDNGYMAINPDALTIHFSKACTWFAKDMFEGKQISSSSISLNVEGLKIIWKKFKNLC